MRKKRIIGIAILLIGIVAIIGYNYIYQDHRDIASEKPAYTFSAQELTQQFEVNEEEATSLYLNNTIQIHGELTNIDGQSLVVDDVVFLVLNEGETTPNQNKLHTNISLKGRCIGYDNLLGEVKLDQAILIE